MNRFKPQREFLIASLTGVAFSLALSVWLLSAFTILSIIAWLTGMEWRNKKPSKEDLRCLAAFAIIYMVYISWMAGTSDIHSGLIGLRLKLPIVIFPLIFAYSGQAGDKERKIIFTGFLSGIIISSAYGLFAGWEAVSSGLADSRTLSPLVSHIRLSLMAVLAIFSAGWYLFRDKERNIWKIFLAVSAAWLTIFIFILSSFTGIALLILLIGLTLARTALKSGRRWIIILSFSVLSAFAAALLVFIRIEVKLFYKPSVNSIAVIPEKTLSGNSYFNDLSRKDLENGNPVWIMICEKELRREWNKRSKIEYDSADLKGQAIRYTLVRYMTSEGLRKDSAGMAALSPTDMSNIEHGMTNHLFSEWSPLRKKIYESVWQVDYYLKGGNPSGHSITQRLEFLKTGWHIFLSNPFFGVGTGDLSDEYSAEYAREKSVLDSGYRLLCHNQFLTFLVSFGITGTIIVVASLLYLFFSRRLYKRFLPLLFFLLIFFSMLSEDTLETHAGVTFFAFFSSLFIFTSGEDDEQQ